MKRRFQIIDFRLKIKCILLLQKTEDFLCNVFNIKIDYNSYLCNWCVKSSFMTCVQVYGGQACLVTKMIKTSKQDYAL